MKNHHTPPNEESHPVTDPLLKTELLLYIIQKIIIKIHTLLNVVA